MKRSPAVRRSALCLLLFASAASAQRGSSDWMTAANDAQRSSWVRSDAKISPKSMAKPGFELVWKMKMGDGGQSRNIVASPSHIDFYIGYRGFRALGFFSVSSDKVIAVDTELGRLEWENKYPPASNVRGTPECPGGMTAAVTRPTGTGYPPLPTGGGGGRSNPAKSGVGAPHEGSVVLAAYEARRAAAPPAPPPVPAAKPAANAAPIDNPFAPRVLSALALTSDGKLHSLWVSNGNEPSPGIPFIPPNAHALGLVAYDKTAYVATTNGCGAAGNGIWAVDLDTQKVSSWKSSQAIAGNAGPAVGPDGTLYAASGTNLVALSPKQLEPLAIHKTSGAAFASSPVVFDYQGRNLIAVASGDGRLHLLDSANLSGGAPLARTTPFSRPGYATGSLTSWQDPAGTRWILAPTHGALAADAGFRAAGDEIKQGAVVAWKVAEKGGQLMLQPAWMSRDLNSPLPPVVVNGVVFALSGGAPSRKAVLYALDALSGAELWNSGDTIASFVKRGGLAVGGSRVYVAAEDGTQYAFGFPIEH